MELNETYSRIGEYIKSRPSETYAQIAATLGLSQAAVARIARLQGIKRRSGRRAAALEAAAAVIDAAGQQPEPGAASDQAAPATEPPAGAAEGTAGVQDEDAEAMA